MSTWPKSPALVSVKVDHWPHANCWHFEVSGHFDGNTKFVLSGERVTFEQADEAAAELRKWVRR